MTDASPDWAELRRLAEAARDGSYVAQWDYRAAASPAAILALLDERAALIDAVAETNRANLELSDALEKARAEVDLLRKICSAAANDYAGILTAMEKATPPSFAEAFKATAKELRESSEFMRLAAEGREDGSIYDDELSKAANANREWRAKAWAAEAEAARLREALDAIAGFAKIDMRGCYERELRDIIRSMTDRARALTGGDHG